MVLSVQDSGKSLEPGQLPVVFDRFYRGNKSRSREMGGTGLGLAIVKAIVEEHAGRVAFEKEQPDTYSTCARLLNFFAILFNRG